MGGSVENEGRGVEESICWWEGMIGKPGRPGERGMEKPFGAGVLVGAMPRKEGS